MATEVDRRVAAALSETKSGHTLPSAFMADPAVFDSVRDHIWHREWVFAGHECELAAPGAFVTLTVGAYPLLVIRGDDGQLRALHNVCRHRGSVLCDAAQGTARLRLTCPYHQWAYRRDGSLAAARSMPADFEPSEHGLLAAHVEVVGGLVYVCVADTPPDIEPFRTMVAPYLAAFDLATAKVAHVSTIVENGSWQLVMENNRECYHCDVSHPELLVSFENTSLHSGVGAAEELAKHEAFLVRCEDAGVPSRFVAAPDFQYRVMRLNFAPGTTSMTLDGQPAVTRRFSGLPAEDTGDVLLYHYPSTWSHFTADHCVTFRSLPLTATTTELRTTWLVPGDAVEGVDYDIARLTEVWLATNRQDADLVARSQRGVSSPAYRPGPYSLEESGVVQFVNWLTTTLATRVHSAT